MTNRKQRKIILGTVTAAAIAWLPVPAIAAGALAVGYSGNPNEGVAFGTSWNFKTEAEARTAALRRCLDFKGAPKAVNFCKVDGSFVDGCLAIAFDSKDDSPGMGWAIAGDRESAQRRAIEICRDHAPSSRRQYCKLATVKCEGDKPSAAEKKK
jgi:Domain of unknown function (DUF4189)